MGGGSDQLRFEAVGCDALRQSARSGVSGTGGIEIVSGLATNDRGLRLTDEVCYHGPNIWSLQPSVVCKLAIHPQDAGRLAEGANKLRGRYPDWIDDSLWRAPDITSGELVGNVVACWALGALNEVRGDLHDAGAVKTFDRSSP